MTVPADDRLRELGFEPQPGPGPTGWLRGEEDWWDLRSCWLQARLRAAPGLGSDALEGLRFERVCFGDRDRLRAPADLTHTSFKGSEFKHVTFTNTILANVYFRECKFSICDFRYTHTTGTTFQDSGFSECDFYRAYFEAATVFTKITFDRVSLDKTWLAGAEGLAGSMFTKSAMVQECDLDTYRQFLDATAGDRPASHELQEALEKAQLDMAEVYRALSGMWSAHGQLHDAGFAYVKCKTLERKFHSPIRRFRANRDRDKRNAERDRLADLDEATLEPAQRDLKKSKKEPPLPIFKQIPSWAGLAAAWAIANYGESMRRVAYWLAGLILIPGVLFSLLGGVQTDSHPPKAVDSLWQCMLFSFQQLTASTHHLQPANSWVELVGATQFFIGVALLGLFGFTLANRLRNA